jgi:hypothetical protein
MEPLPCPCTSSAADGCTQAHALLAVAEHSLQPSNLQALAGIGTAAELAGFATAGSPVHLLAMARLVCVSADAWGPDDARVEAALHAMLAVSGDAYVLGEAGLEEEGGRGWDGGAHSNAACGAAVVRQLA